jgi:hypothetical protein
MADNRARHLRSSLFTAGSALALSLVTGGPAALAASHAAADSHQTQGTSGTSGSTSQPQPTSNADQNSGGANGQCPGGPYCSTRDGSPSGNGNGNGNATGKPCAGCVGKADNKNPQGQMPNGTDHNAGYECDRNHGIGRSNPAHTGCTTPTTSGGGDCTTNPTAPGCTPGGGSDCTTNPTAPGCTTPPTTGGGGSDCTTNPTAPGCPSGPPTSGGGGTQCTPTAANNFCSTVEGEQESKPPASQAPSAEVLSESVTQPPAATTTSLPLTGAIVAPLVAVGACALCAGVALLVVVSRRRQPQSD